MGRNSNDTMAWIVRSLIAVCSLSIALASWGLSETYSAVRRDVSEIKTDLKQGFASLAERIGDVERQTAIDAGRIAAIEGNRVGKR